MTAAKINFYLTISQAAKFVGVTPNTLRRWEELGKLQSYRNPINNYRLYKQEDLESFLKTIK